MVLAGSVKPSSVVVHDCILYSVISLPLEWMRSIAISVSVCFGISETLPDFQYMLSVAMAHCNAICYVLPVLWMTSFFLVMGQN